MGAVAQCMGTVEIRMSDSLKFQAEKFANNCVEGLHIVALAASRVPAPEVMRSPPQHQLQSPSQKRSAPFRSLGSPAYQQCMQL